MKCESCNVGEIENIVWIKRMVYICKFSRKMSEETNQDGEIPIVRYGRDAFLEMVRDDVENNKNEGEWFSCEPCFEEIGKNE